MDIYLGKYTFLLACFVILIIPSLAQMFQTYLEDPSIRITGQGQDKRLLHVNCGSLPRLPLLPHYSLVIHRPPGTT